MKSRRWNKGTYLIVRGAYARDVRIVGNPGEGDMPNRGVEARAVCTKDHGGSVHIAQGKP